MWKIALVALIGLSGCMSNASRPIAPITERELATGVAPAAGEFENARESDVGGSSGDPADGVSERVISAEELSAAGLPVSEGGLPSAAPVISAPLGAVRPAGDGSLLDSPEAESIDAESESAPVSTGIGSGTSNIVAYARSTTHEVGEQLYDRSDANADAAPPRPCDGFSSADSAQQAFLDQGGPQDDPLGLDPDGDGFACAWDPVPFRARGG